MSLIIMHNLLFHLPASACMPALDSMSLTDAHIHCLHPQGMNGGEIAIVPPPKSSFASEGASLVGNTCLYGATGGRLFVNGRAGERFAVSVGIKQPITPFLRCPAVQQDRECGGPS
jgi:hypothetical protein